MLGKPGSFTGGQRKAAMVQQRALMLGRGEGPSLGGQGFGAGAVLPRSR